MIEVDFLHFKPGSGPWYRHDPRLKLLELAAWSTLGLTASPVALGVLGAMLIVLHALSGISISRMRRPLTFWFILALVIVVTSALGSEGSALNLHLPGIRLTLPISIDGMLAGALKAARLLVVLLAGQLLATTTDPADLSGALRKIFAFLPRGWAGTIATSISLTLTFIPQILDAGKTTRDAALSRGLESRRSILHRAMALGLPMVEGLLRRTELTTEAMLSRLYVTDPTPPELHLRPADFLWSAGVILPPLLVSVWMG